MFGTDVGVAVNMSEAEISKRLSKPGACKNEKILSEAKEQIGDWDEEVAAGTVWGRMCTLGGGFLILLNLKPECGWIFNAGIIAHEMTHVTQYLLRDRRVPLKESTEEIHAYLQEMLLVKTLEKMFE